MRVYPYWYIRFGVAIPFAGLVFVAVEEFLSTGSTFTLPAIFAALMSLLIAGIGVRAFVGGVEATSTHFIVRNTLSSRRIPRAQVVEVTTQSIKWLNGDGQQRVTPLEWFWDGAWPGVVRRYNARAVETVRSWHDPDAPPPDVDVASHHLNWIVLLACGLGLVAGGASGVVAVLVAFGVSGLSTAPAILTIALVVLGVGCLIRAVWLYNQRRP